jgi:hypothetical protein
MEIRMACAAVSYGFDVLDDFVLDIQVTLVALDFVHEDMGRMHQVSIAVLFEPVSLPVALVAVLPGDCSIAHDDIAVTFVTCKLLFKYQRVVIPGDLFTNQVFFSMAVSAFGNTGIKFALFEMTYETGAFRDSDVLTLNNLRMTACALELLSAFEIRKMNCVVENDFVEPNLSL